MTQQSDARDDVAETLKQKLPASLGTPSMPGTEGWSLESVRVERFFGHPVVSIGLTGNDRRHDFHLFPANALEEPYYRDEHFDFVYIDDAQENRGRRDRAVIDQFVRWLGATFRPRTRKLSPIATAEVKPPPPAPRRLPKSRCSTRWARGSRRPCAPAHSLPSRAGPSAA